MLPLGMASGIMKAAVCGNVFLSSSAEAFPSTDLPQHVASEVVSKWPKFERLIPPTRMTPPTGSSTRVVSAIPNGSSGPILYCTVSLSKISTDDMSVPLFPATTII